RGSRRAGRSRGSQDGPSQLLDGSDEAGLHGVRRRGHVRARRHARGAPLHISAVRRRGPGLALDDPGLADAAEVARLDGAPQDPRVHGGPGLAEGGDVDEALAHDLLDLGADAVGHAGQVRRELPELRVVRLEGAHGVSSPGWLVRSSTHSRSCSQAYDDRPSEATDSTVPVSQAGALSSTDRTRTRAPTSWSSAPRGSDTVTRRRVTSWSADSVSRPWTGS